MDPSTATCVLSFGVSMLLKLLKSRRCRTSSIVGVVVPAKGGCSRLIESLAQNDRYLLLDLNDNIKFNLTADELRKFEISKDSPSFALHVQPILKAYIQKIKKDFKGRRVIVFSSNKRDLIYCGIPKSSIHSYIPTSDFTSILESTYEPNDALVFRNSRLELLLSSKEQERSIYESYDHLKKLICARYALEPKI